jgi:hypothetical protein
MDPSTIAGIWPIPYAFFDARGHVDRSAMRRQIDACVVVFLMQSVENVISYGKRVTARRLGLGGVHDRPPAEPPTAFGLAAAERHAAHLGAYGPGA